MSYKMVVKKGQDGWKAETRIPLEFAGGRTLIVSTRKGYRSGIDTYLQAAFIKDEGGFQSVSFVVFQDFNVTMKNYPAKRVTDKAVIEAHYKSLENIEAYIAKANAFYQASEDKALEAHAELHNM